MIFGKSRNEIQNFSEFLKKHPELIKNKYEKVSENNLKHSEKNLNILKKNDLVKIDDELNKQDVKKEIKNINRTLVQKNIPQPTPFKNENKNIINNSTNKKEQLPIPVMKFKSIQNPNFIKRKINRPLIRNGPIML